MVMYQDWTSIAFEVARQKGFDPATPTQNRLSSGGRGFAPNNANAQLLQVAAAIWNDRRDELSTATRAEAEAIADDEIEVNA